VEYILKNR